MLRRLHTDTPETQTHTHIYKETQRPRWTCRHMDKETYRLTDIPSRPSSEPFLDKLHSSPCLSLFSPPLRNICATLTLYLDLFLVLGSLEDQNGTPQP